MNKSDFGWLVGLLEGEGSFTCAKRDGCPRIELRMTDQDVVERAAKLMGIARVYAWQDRRANRKLCYIARLSGDPALALMRRVLPYVGNRRATQIRTTLSIAAKRPGPVRGEHQYNAKLTEESVREIRRSNLTQTELAKVYRVSRSLIQQVIQRSKWRHVK